jgi:hypothetical protein
MTGIRVLTCGAILLLSIGIGLLAATQSPGARARATLAETPTACPHSRPATRPESTSRCPYGGSGAVAPVPPNNGDDSRRDSESRPARKTTPADLV